MKALKIKDNIYWVGAIDWDLRNFHGYLTQRGSTYNAYLVIDEKITLIDTVKSYCSEEMIKRISSVIDPSKIDYIVSNHVEMDHSGSLPEIVKLAPNAKVYTSLSGVKGLTAHYGSELNYEVVKPGVPVILGKRSLQFVFTPMVHWPDNMLTYMPEEQILFSNDAFGQHIASSQRFDSEYSYDIIMEEARKYYANIVLPYGAQVQKALEQASKLDIKVIAPSHGIIWKEHISEIVKNYYSWASNETAKKAVIVYDTMWGSTKKMALAIAEAFEAEGYNYSLNNLNETHISDIMTDLIDAEFVCVGSPTLNNGMLPSVAAFLTYLKGLAPKNRKAIVFGSYGWGGQSVGLIEDYLKASDFELVASERISYIPSSDQLDAIKEKIKTFL